MTSRAPRRVTRGYAAALTFAAIVLSTALVIAVWGVLSAMIGRNPVMSDVKFWAAPFIVILGLALLAGGLWQQAIVLLRGRRTPAWGIMISLAGGVYLLWCLIGMAFGMDIADTWMSPFAASLAVIWVVASLLFWAVLARRVYTDRPPPRWPWERNMENGGS